MRVDNENVIERKVGVMNVPASVTGEWILLARRHSCGAASHYKISYIYHEHIPPALESEEMALD